MASNILVLKAKGLNTSPNELDREEGSLIEANNVIIRRDGVIEQSRGFKLWGDALPNGTDRVKQILSYRDRILRHYSNKLQYDNQGDGTFLDFSGTYNETQDGNRIKSIEASGNFYFTTSEGVKKISAKTPDDFSQSSNFITQAGGIKAVDFQASAIYSPGNTTGFLQQNSTVAYRVLWATNDKNGNFLRGAPSQSEIVANSLGSLLISDIGRLLAILDSFSSPTLIDDGNYVNTILNLTGMNLASSGSDVRTNLIDLCKKIDNDVFLASSTVGSAPLTVTNAVMSGTGATAICTITFSASPIPYFFTGKKILLSGFNTTSNSLNAIQQVLEVRGPSHPTAPNTITFLSEDAGPVTLSSAQIHYAEYQSITPPPEITVLPASGEQWTYLQTYLSAIYIKLQKEPTSIISTTDAAPLLSFELTNSSNVRLEITVPDGVTSDYFYQVYRSNQLQAISSPLEDLVPSDELFLAYEAYPTDVELTNKKISIVDETLDSFLGANLYTNASTGEGIAQANDIPPFCVDINRFKESIFYANTKTKQRMFLSLFGVKQMRDDFNSIPQIIPTVTIANKEGTSNTYKFVTGIQQKTTLTIPVGTTGTTLNGKYFLIESSINKYCVWFESTTTTDPTPLTYTSLKIKLKTTDTANIIATKIRDNLGIYLFDFLETDSTLNSVTITNLNYGKLSAAISGTSAFTISIIYGRGENIAKQKTQIVALATSNYASSSTADYITLNTVNDSITYILWFKNGTSTAPVVDGLKIAVDLTGLTTAAQVASKINDSIPSDFTKFYTSGSDTVIVENTLYGDCTSSSITSAVPLSPVLGTVSTLVEGGLNILLSTSESVDISVDETARSMVRIINKNEFDVVSAYYVSSIGGVPGKMIFEGDSLNASEYYIMGNNANTGISFNPDIGPAKAVVSLTDVLVANGTKTTVTATAHGLIDGDYVFITQTDSNPKLNNIYQVTYINANSFSINATLITNGKSYNYSKISDVFMSQNEVKPNRIYYSKYQQPEAVPILNYFDVGAEEKPILRIFPLRDSLFVFKSDGLYRVSGETIPFSVALFDSSVVLLAPDSICVVDNLIYVWTNQGVQVISESGTQTISRPIDNQILKLASSNYINFSKATWGIGYGSDSSVTMWTVLDTTSEVAQIGFRYNTLTNSWTTLTKSPTCGIIFDVDNKMYLGMSDINYIEQERKTFGRFDYAGREYSVSLNAGKYFGDIIKLSSVSDVAIGDAIVQEQRLTVYEYNMLLQKLDIDPLLPNNFYSTLVASAGHSLRSKIENLAIKLDTDTATPPRTIPFTGYFEEIDSKFGTITHIGSGKTPVITTSAPHGLITGRRLSITGTNSTPSIDGDYTITVIDSTKFQIIKTVLISGTTGGYSTINLDAIDIETCYDAIVSKLNSDPNVGFSNYRQLDSYTTQEAIVLSVNTVTKEVKLNKKLDYVIGDLIIYKAIPYSYTYSPNTFGDPLNYKHIRQATLMMESRAITSMSLEFKTDLKPVFIGIDFSLDGNGIFGNDPFGEGFFGGGSNAAPVRTIIPRDCQRCRYIITRFKHNVARESFHVLGVTLTANISESERAYR